MKINVGRLRKEPGAEESFQFTLAKPEDIGEIKIASPIRVEGKVTNTGNILRVTGHISTVVLAACGRCLDDVKTPLELDFTEVYCHESEWDNVTGDPADKNEFILIREELLDLAIPVKENIILDMPMKVLCFPGCPGLCPHCGQNLKQGKCECREVTVDPRLAVLEKLKNSYQ